MTIKRLFEIDIPLFGSVLLLCGFGILFIYSSGITSTGTLVSNEYFRQIIWTCVGIFLFFVFAMIDYRKLYNISMYLYAIIIFVLIYTKIFGKIVNGARSWIGIASFGIQPSEFAKVITILFLARYLEMSRKADGQLRRLFISALIVFLPIALVLIQPDLGTSLVFIPIFLAMAYIAGIHWKYLFFISLLLFLGGFLTVLPLWQQRIIGSNSSFLRFFSNSRSILISSSSLALISGLGAFGFNRYKKQYFYWITYFAMLLCISLIISFIGRAVLKEYQIMRLIVFLNPDIDPRGSGWNIIQSITAIGSGGLWGKGFLQGTQSHYRFLPQQSTDFIFSIFSEETGFLGGVLIFSLFLIISLRIIRILKSSKDDYGVYICAGVVAVVVFHFMVNVGMAMGTMPITGIPLLFLSYGGSSLLAIMMAMGIVMSVYLRRFEH